MDVLSDLTPGAPEPVGSISTSRTLLSAVRDGDEPSRERLITLYWPLVYSRYLARVPEEDRRDLAQTVFKTVLEKIGTFEKRFDGPAFRGWLYRIAYYKVGDYIRQKRRDARAVEGSSRGRPALGAGPHGGDRDADERGLLVLRALELVRPEFEPDTYQAAWDQLIEGRPAVEVAAERGKSLNAVYIAKSRVLRRVRDILIGLSELEDEPGPCRA